MRHRRCGHVEDQRRRPRPWRREGDRVGAIDRAARAGRRDHRDGVDHRQRHQATLGERLDVEVERGKMVRTRGSPGGRSPGCGPSPAPSLAPPPAPPGQSRCGRRPARRRARRRAPPAPRVRRPSRFRGLRHSPASGRCRGFCCRRAPPRRSSPPGSRPPSASSDAPGKWRRAGPSKQTAMARLIATSFPPTGVTPHRQGPSDDRVGSAPYEADPRVPFPVVYKKHTTTPKGSLLMSSSQGVMHDVGLPTTASSCAASRIITKLPRPCSAPECRSFARPTRRCFGCPPTIRGRTPTFARPPPGPASPRSGSCSQSGPAPNST